jgi:hypothetical protein
MSIDQQGATGVPDEPFDPNSHLDPDTQTQAIPEATPVFPARS